MIRIAFTAWLLFLSHGLALATSVTSELSTSSGVIYKECSIETSTSEILPQATVEVESEYLNLSGIIRFESVTTVVVSCPTTSRAWNKSSVFPYEQSSRPISWSNQTFNGSSFLITKATIMPDFTQTASFASSSTLAGSSLVFDYRPAPSVPLPTSSNTPMFTGFGYHAVYADPLVWLLFGMVHLGMA
ncbi:hypothetical protein B0J14DRAFT_565925 [Halenospora varia]|nr:hypothetical protein B0J14DRAFT_565925 [Halenospora varia]